MIRSLGDKTPKIADSAFISEAAYVIGDVEIGENSGIWPGAVVRGDFGSIRIGRNTMIEDNCVVHGAVPMEIGDNVLIGHAVVVHGKKVGNNTLVGNNATILDDAEIYMEGDKSITFKSSKPCPVHEACKILGMDSKRICKAVCESSATEFLQRIDPRLRFIIQHKKVYNV